MCFLDAFNLILFDLDGLLVDTEHLHFRAYTQMCEQHGFSISWSFKQYCTLAHIGNNAIKEEIQKKAEFAKKIPWSVLYEEKQKIIKDLLVTENIPLMPGVEKILTLTSNKKRCVVTNSTKLIVANIVNKNSILRTIPYWITREDYENPKPAQDAYKAAVLRYGKKEDKIIILEDTIKGLMAAKGFGIRVLICPKDHAQALDEDIIHFSSLNELCSIKDFN